MTILDNSPYTRTHSNLNFWPLYIFCVIFLLSGPTIIDNSPHRFMGNWTYFWPLYMYTFCVIFSLSGPTIIDNSPYRFIGEELEVTCFIIYDSKFSTQITEDMITIRSSYDSSIQNTVYSNFEKNSTVASRTEKFLMVTNNGKSLIKFNCDFECGTKNSVLMVPIERKNYGY